MDEVFEWQTPTGDIFRLDHAVDNVDIVTSISGRHMPALRGTDDVVPLQPGQRHRSVFHDRREVSLGLAFSAAGDIPLRDTIRVWLTRLDPTRGAGKLRVTGPAGTIRELTCRYQEGLGLVEGGGTRDPLGTVQTAVVTFEAVDPYWMDADPTVVSWQTGTPQSFFPIFPLHLGSSQIFAAAVIDPQSDVATYPVWTISGPGSQIVLQNSTTGRTLGWSGGLGLDEQLTIDTRPGSQSPVPKSVRLQDGSNQFGLLTDWDFWPLVPGSNEFEVQMTGATGDSLVTLSYQSRYLGA